MPIVDSIFKELTFFILSILLNVQIPDLKYLQQNNYL